MGRITNILSPQTYTTETMYSYINGILYDMVAGTFMSTQIDVSYHEIFKTVREHCVDYVTIHKTDFYDNDFGKALSPIVAEVYGNNIFNYLFHRVISGFISSDTNQAITPFQNGCKYRCVDDIFKADKQFYEAIESYFMSDLMEFKKSSSMPIEFPKYALIPSENKHIINSVSYELRAKYPKDFAGRGDLINDVVTLLFSVLIPSDFSNINPNMDDVKGLRGGQCEQGKQRFIGDVVIDYGWASVAHEIKNKNHDVINHKTGDIYTYNVDEYIQNVIGRIMIHKKTRQLIPLSTYLAMTKYAQMKFQIQNIIRHFHSVVTNDIISRFTKLTLEEMKNTSK